MKYRLLEKIEKAIKASTISFALATAVFVMPAMSSTVIAAEIQADDNSDDDDDSSPIPVKSTKVTLYESYSSDYDMYEESMDDMFFFYCNVGNGSFTSDPVKFDFPGNIKYTVERGGEEVAYRNKDEIKEVGNYVVRLSAEMDGMTYTSNFRFSLKEATGDGTDGNPLDGVDDNDVNDFGLSPEDLVIDENDDISDEEIDRIIEQSGANIGMEGLAGLSDGVDVNLYTGFVRNFEPSTRMYSITLKSGEKIITNVPEGAIVNGGVTISIPSGVTTTVYKDGQMITADNTLNFTEPGFYKVVFSSQTTQFYRFYPDEKTYPFMTFRIVGEAVNDMEVFNAPAGCKIIEVAGEYNQYTDENGNSHFNYDSYWMDEEGLYIYTIYDSSVDASYTVRIKRDITAPSGYANITKSSASLYFESPDIARVDVYKDGEQIPYEGPNFKGRGDYVINVYDQAGNMKTITFELADAFNKGTFFTFLISFILIVTGFVYIRLERTYIRTR